MVLQILKSKHGGNLLLIKNEPFFYFLNCRNKKTGLMTNTGWLLPPQWRHVIHIFLSQRCKREDKHNTAHLCVPGQSYSVIQGGKDLHPFELFMQIKHKPFWSPCTLLKFHCRSMLSPLWWSWTSQRKAITTSLDIRVPFNHQHALLHNAVTKLKPAQLRTAENQRPTSSSQLNT